MTQTISTYLQEHAKRVRENAEWRVKNLTTKLTVELLNEAFEGIRKGGATGTDEITWGDYDKERNRNLCDLHRRLKEQIPETLSFASVSNLPRSTQATDHYDQF